MKIILASGEAPQVVEESRNEIALSVPADKLLTYVTCNPSGGVQAKAGHISRLLGCQHRPLEVIEAHKTSPVESLEVPAKTGVVYYAGGDSRRYLSFWALQGAAFRQWIVDNWHNEQVVYTGASAGAMIAGSSVDGFDWLQWRRAQQFGRTNRGGLAGLGVINAQIIPHWGSGRIGARKIKKFLMNQVISAYRQANPQLTGGDRQLILLPDTAALFVDTVSGQARVIGNDALLVEGSDRRLLTDNELRHHVNFGVPVI